MYLERQMSQIANILLKNKKKIGELAWPDFKTYFKSIVIKTGGYGERINK